MNMVLFLYQLVVNYKIMGIKYFYRDRLSRVFDFQFILLMTVVGTAVYTYVQLFLCCHATFLHTRSIAWWPKWWLSGYQMVPGVRIVGSNAKRCASAKSGERIKDMERGVSPHLFSLASLRIHAPLCIAPHYLKTWSRLDALQQNSCILASTTFLRIADWFL